MPWITIDKEHLDIIIDRFDLFRPIYSSTTNYGHFGKPYLPWEALDLF
jgi:S-adenosylmethionine synthetase